MNFRTILVHVDDSPQAPYRLDVAVRLAKLHGAQLVGAYLVPTLDLTPFTAAMLPSDLVERRRVAAVAGQETAEAMFRDAAGHAALDDAEWRAPAGDARHAAVVHARYVDLAVLGQPARGEPDYAFTSEVANALVMSAGRPVLFVPFGGVGNQLGERILIAWKDSRESARAVADAMPFLERAKEIVAVAVGSREEGLFDIVAERQLRAFLERHGVVAQFRHVAGPESEAGELLLSEATAIGTDLIVMGGHSRPRITELVWGGVTRDMLHAMTLPVLMSH